MYLENPFDESLGKEKNKRIARINCLSHNGLYINKKKRDFNIRTPELTKNRQFIIFHFLFFSKHSLLL